MLFCGLLPKDMIPDLVCTGELTLNRFQSIMTKTLREFVIKDFQEKCMGVVLYEM